MKKILLGLLFSIGILPVISYGRTFNIVFSNPEGFFIPLQTNSVVLTNAFWCDSSGKSIPALNQIQPGGNTINLCSIADTTLYHFSATYGFQIDSSNYVACDFGGTEDNDQITMAYANPTNSNSYTANCSYKIVQPTQNAPAQVTYTINPQIKDKV